MNTSLTHAPDGVEGGEGESEQKLVRGEGGERDGGGQQSVAETSSDEQIEGGPPPSELEERSREDYGCAPAGNKAN